MDDKAMGKTEQPTRTQQDRYVKMHAGTVPVPSLLDFFMGNPTKKGKQTMGRLPKLIVQLKMGQQTNYMGQTGF
jgi:hypothetical protein